MRMTECSTKFPDVCFSPSLFPKALEMDVDWFYSVITPR